MPTRSEPPRRRGHERCDDPGRAADGVPITDPNGRAAQRAVPPAGYRRLWLAVGLVGLGALIAVHLTGGSHHVLTFDVNADKIEHVLAFGAAMLWFGQLYRRGIESRLFCIALILAGIVLEYVQHALGHYDPVEYGDMAANAAGACIGLLLLRTPAANIISAMDRWLARRRERTGPPPATPSR